MGLSLPHILLLAGVAALLLGGGRFSALMGDVAKGVKQFKSEMAWHDDEPEVAAPRLSQQAAEVEVASRPAPVLEDNRRN